jgi:hypothetical protein
MSFCLSTTTSSVPSNIKHEQWLQIATKKHSQNRIILQMQSPHDHVSDVMITDLLID